MLALLAEMARNETETLRERMGLSTNVFDDAVVEAPVQPLVARHIAARVEQFRGAACRLTLSPPDTAGTT